ncbi:MAG TPA: histidine phosphatase family protein [Acidimicrobiales bacterium]|nr:histidine phosphatase family protein [Acidimicrobiales bacterium]
MELLIIRHGLPVRIDDAGGPADPELSELGHRQAQQMADWLRHERITSIWTSPMKRARQTAEPLAAAFGTEAIVDDELAEFDRNSHFYVPIEELKAAGDPRYQQIIKGEQLEGEVDPYTFREVVTVAIERIIEANRGGAVAIVCHGGVINGYASHVLGIDFPLFFQPHYTSVNRFLASSAGHRSVASLNEVGHLHGTRSKG